MERTYTFQASKNRQRAALLEANGNIYVGFASFCDFFANLSRGWVLGWNASTLTPLAANQLNDKLAQSTISLLFVVRLDVGQRPGGIRRRRRFSSRREIPTERQLQ